MDNKMIHSNEFRLRVLLTNACNKNCDFCLNDFQKKTPEEYANTFDLIDCIRAYGQFMKSINEKSIITFSGGEPGLHPNLETILPMAKYHCDVVKVVTNGTALRDYYDSFVDMWHVGVTEKLNKVLNFKNILVQIVVRKEMNIKELNNLVGFYRNHDIPVKLFVDFFEKDRENLYEKIEQVKQIYDVETRFTGKQINRGAACQGCEKDCVTLKALWYFPDGTSSTCPQGVKPLYDDDSWDETMEKACAAHRI